MPFDSINTYAYSIGVQSQKALLGSWVEKKMRGNLFRSNRFIWIDHLTKTLHWAKTNDKLGPHKSLKLESVLKISTAPKGPFTVLTKELYGKKTSTTEFDKPNNSIRLFLTSDMYKDLHLPVSITNADLEDWVTILLDCCGFKNWQAATHGRTYDESKIHHGSRNLNSRPRPVEEVAVIVSVTPTTTTTPANTSPPVQPVLEGLTPTTSNTTLNAPPSRPVEIVEIFEIMRMPSPRGGASFMSEGKHRKYF